MDFYVLFCGTSIPTIFSGGSAPSNKSYDLTLSTALFFNLRYNSAVGDLKRNGVTQTAISSGKDAVNYQWKIYQIDNLTPNDKFTANGTLFIVYNQ